MPNGGAQNISYKPFLEPPTELQVLKRENARLRAIQIAARVWCDKEMEKYQIDPDACEAIAKILADVMVKQEESQQACPS